MLTCSRRRFLSQTASAGAAALLAPLLPGRARSLPLAGQAGIQLYAVKDSLAADPAATLRRIRSIGFREVETAGFAGLTASAFRRLLDDSGLVAPSAHLDFSDPAAAFEQAHALGAHYAASGSLRSLIAGPHQGGMTPEEAHRTAELANRLGEQARRAGLGYVYHNHDFEFASQGTAVGYDVLLAETDPSLVQFEIDCGWMVLGGRDPRDYFGHYPHRFPMIHVKDFLPAAVGGAEHPGAELGHGMIDYRPIFAAAEKAGLKHYFAEQEGPFTRMSQIEAARQAFDYLRPIG
ncbi:MAG TPA: sugar phosphate isomerase/epimerase [Steroidobacteraceae bacterium]|nr:sugar phosphate isomerase/epimerase [Steroidobacteraceae bacterium]